MPGDRIDLRRVRNLEAFKGAPLVQPIWRSADGSTAGAAGQNVQHALRDGWKPMPSATWSPQPGLELRSEVFAIERNGQPVTFLRHRLRNTGGTRIDGTLSLIVRPMQMNPPWQNGGLSPIRDVAIDGQAVRINGRTLLQSLTPVTAFGAAPLAGMAQRNHRDPRCRPAALHATGARRRGSCLGCVELPRVTGAGRQRCHRGRVPAGYCRRR